MTLTEADHCTEIAVKGHCIFDYLTDTMVCLNNKC